MRKSTTPPPISLDYPDYEYEDDIYKKVYNVSVRINCVLQLLTVLVNSLHLIVLFRKELRSHAIYIIMMAICFSDNIYVLIDFYNAAGEISWFPILFSGSGEMNCLRDDYLEVNIPIQILISTADILKRFSVWLSILMATIRLLSVIFPMSQRVQRVTKPKGTILAVLTMFVFWTVFSTWHFAFYRILWLPDNMSQICQSLFKNSVKPRYVLASPENLRFQMDRWGFVVYVLNFTTTTIYPILTISLLYQLHNIRKRRRNMNRNEGNSDNTTKLILFMTVTFMLSEGLAGVQAVLMYHIERILKVQEDFGIAVIASQTPLKTLQTLNSFSHAFVCFLLSSQYRDTIKTMFTRKTKLRQSEFTRSTSRTTPSKSQ